MTYMWYNTGEINPIYSDRSAAVTASGLSNSKGATVTMPHSNSNASHGKTCAKCGETKPLSEYHRNRSRNDGVGQYCKPCVSEYSKKRRRQNPEHHRGIVRASKRRYRERHNAEYRERIASDPEYRKKRNDKSRSWRQRNRDRIIEYNRKRSQENPEYMVEASRRSQKKYPHKHAAGKAVREAVRQGYFPPAWTMVCEECQEAQAAHWHHHKGYVEEHKLDVIALCTECHGKAHWVD